MNIRASPPPPVLVEVGGVMELEDIDEEGGVLVILDSGRGADCSADSGSRAISSSSSSSISPAKGSSSSDRAGGEEIFLRVV